MPGEIVASCFRCKAEMFCMAPTAGVSVLVVCPACKTEQRVILGVKEKPKAPPADRPMYSWPGRSA